ncbi:MAG: patatin-like phospholipase family protein [Terracidiphilus sp.]
MRRLRCSIAHIILLPVAVLAFRFTAPAQTGNQTQFQTSPSDPDGQRPYKVDLVPPQNESRYGTDGIETSEASVGSAPAVTANLPAVTPAGRPVIGLVLEGGGALGLAHIGVLEWFDENHIPIDRLSGTSMGALIGGLYASGHSVEELHTLATGGIFKTIFTVEVPYTDVSYRRREDRQDMPQAIQLGLKGGVSIRNSLLTDSALDDFLREEFASYNSHTIDFDELPIPFRCVATDLTDLNALIFRGGPLPTAVRASISIPGVFSPVDYHHHYLVDGAIVDNLPVSVARRDLHASVIIAVHLTDPPFTEGDVNSVVSILGRTLSAGTSRNVEENQKQADILVMPETDKLTTTDYDKAQQLIVAGYKAAERQRAQLIRYALSDADWETYLTTRKARIHPHPGLLQALRVETAGVAPGAAGAERQVAFNLAPLKQQPIEPRQIADRLNPVEASGSYEAAFETFSEAAPAPGATPQVAPVPAATPDTGVLVRLTPVPNGPTFLMMGIDLAAETSNVTRTDFDFRFIDQNVGGFGSELRGDLRLGFLTQASGQYYRLLTPDGWFVQPHLDLLREPVYEWVNQMRVSEWFEQQAGGGLDLGRTFSRNLQASIKFHEQEIRWHLTAGDVPAQDISGTSQTAVAHLVYDKTESGTISPNGRRIELTAGAIFNTVASVNAPLLELRTINYFSWRQKNLLVLSVDANSYLRRNIADPLRFTLGGPFRLSASSMDEYRATDDYLVRFGYLRRLASLPTGLGQGLYFTTAYEAGEVWTPEQPAYLRQDVVSGVVAATPAGLITIAGSVGDAGRRKIFVSLGKPF